MKHFLYFFFILLSLFSCESNIEGEWSSTPFVYHFSIDKEIIELNYTGTQNIIPINTNGKWTANSNVDWISINQPEELLKNTGLEIFIKENNTTNNREGLVYVKSFPLDSIVTIKICQTGKSLSIEKDTLLFASSDIMKGVSIKAEGSVLIKPSAPWITTETIEDVVNVKVTENDGFEPREGKISFEIEGLEEEFSRQLIIIQDSKYFFSIDKESIEQSSNPGLEILELTTNDEWTASSNKEWITLLSKSGNGKSLIKIELSENNTTDDRDGQIYITGTTCNKTISIAVMQKGKYLSLSNNVLQFNSSNNKIQTINIFTDGKFVIEKSASWISFSEKDNVLSINVSNNTSYSSRSGIISVSLNGLNSGELLQTIRIEQEGKSFIDDALHDANEDALHDANEALTDAYNDLKNHT